MGREWALILKEDGFPGVTFAKRPDVRYGVRPTPYYQIDGSLELLEKIQAGLAEFNIKSTINKTKYFNSLEIFGIKNCIMLSEVLGVRDEWVDSLHNDFSKKKHLDPEGIKEIHRKFGKKSQLTYDMVCKIVDAAKGDKLREKLEDILYPPTV